MERFPGGISSSALQSSQPPSSVVLRSSRLWFRGPIPHPRVGREWWGLEGRSLHKCSSPGFSETVYGRKRWFLTAPEDQPLFHPNRTTLQWLLEDYQTVKQDVSWPSKLARPGRTLIELLIVDQVIRVHHQTRRSHLLPSRLVARHPEYRHLCFYFYISQSLISSSSGFRRLWRTPYERMCSASYVREIGERSNLSKDYLSERGRPGTVERLAGSRDFGRLRADDDGVR